MEFPHSPSARPESVAVNSVTLLILAVFRRRGPERAQLLARDRRQVIADAPLIVVGIQAARDEQDLQAIPDLQLSIDLARDIVQLRCWVVAYSEVVRCQLLASLADTRAAPAVCLQAAAVGDVVRIIQHRGGEVPGM